MAASDWFVGSNGAWFRDMGCARYCVAMIGPDTFETSRNGVVFGLRHDSVNSAKQECELYAGEAR